MKKSWAHRAVRFAGALARHIAAGARQVQAAVYEARLSICRACPELDGNRCKQCGCRVAGDVVAKARWASERCPLGKWIEDN